jgi:cobalt/nickel transport system permease protein
MTAPVAGGLFIAAGAGIAYASAKARTDLGEKRIPLLGVLGAFVFAAQMVNFPVLPGTSGHFVGAALLAIVLGPHAAALGMAAIVIVQCLVYQDGGLLALGANLVNMALVGPYAAYAAYRVVVGRAEAVSRSRLYTAAFVASLCSVLAGAVLVPLEVTAAGVSRVPVHVFLGWMGAVHALIGIAEGTITFAVLVALRSLRPDIVPVRGDGAAGLPPRTVVVSILAGAILVGAFLSLAASESPDGLESTLAHVSVIDDHLTGPAAPETAVATFAPLGDYTRPGGGWYWTTVSGVLGVILVLGVGTAVRAAISSRRGSATTA